MSPGMVRHLQKHQPILRQLYLPEQQTNKRAEIFPGEFFPDLPHTPEETIRRDGRKVVTLVIGGWAWGRSYTLTK